MRGSPLLTLLRRRRSILSLWLVVTLTLQPAALFQAEAPEWWTTRGVLIPGAAPDDHAVLNQGQLKHLASAAVAEMDATLTGGAGPVLTSMVASWQDAEVTAENYAAVNLGQLKAVASKFYTRMGLPYPWADSPNAPDHYALANLGQAKALFAFVLDSQFIDVTTDPAWPLLQGVLDGTLAGELTIAEYAAVTALINYLRGEEFSSDLETAMGQPEPPAGASEIAAVIEEASTTTGAESLVLAQPLGPGEDGMMLVKTGKFYGGGILSPWGPNHIPVTDGEVRQGFMGGWNQYVLQIPNQSISFEGDKRDLMLSAYNSAPYSPLSFAQNVRTDGHPLELFARHIVWTNTDGQVREWQNGESIRLEVKDPEEPHAARHSAARTYLVVEKRWTNPLMLYYGIPWPAAYGEVETVGVGAVTFVRNSDGQKEMHLDEGTLSSGIAAQVIGSPAAVTISCPAASAVPGMTEKMTMVSLLPIEVLQPQIALDGSVVYDQNGMKMEKVDKVRMCRWTSSRTGGRVDRPNFPRFDGDQIVIKIPEAIKPGAAGIAVRVRTMGSGQPFNDAGNNIWFAKSARYPGYFVSDPIALVSDVDYDQLPVGYGSPSDNMTGDPTFIARPGGKLNLECEELLHSIQIPIKPFTNRILVQNVYVGYGVHDRAGIAICVSENLRRMREIYAMNHIEVVQVEEVYITDSDFMAAMGFSAASGGSQHAITLFNIHLTRKIVRTRALGQHVAKLVWIPPHYRGPSNPCLGINLKPVPHVSPDVSLLFLDDLNGSEVEVRSRAYTAAHEVGHGLGLALITDHMIDHSIAYDSWHLMARWGVSNMIIPGEPDRSSKNWYMRDGTTMKLNIDGLCPPIAP